MFSKPGVMHHWDISECDSVKTEIILLGARTSCTSQIVEYDSVEADVHVETILLSRKQ